MDFARYQKRPGTGVIWLSHSEAWIDNNEWDFDGKMNAFDLEDLKVTQPRAPDRPAPIQGRRQTQRFDHQNFLGRNNGFKKPQVCSRCQ